MARIVIFDSGVGGLTIYKEIQHHLGMDAVNHSLIFVSDNAAYPYGTKNDDDLLNRVSLIAQNIDETYAPDILVVACNTASTHALASLRQQLECELVGVVPAIKPAAKLSKTKYIGLLATPATLKRAYTAKLIKDFASNCQLIQLGSSELVDMAEQSLSGEGVDKQLLARVLEPFLAVPELDVLVLACTHFPLLKTEIDEFFISNNRVISLLDSGQAIARRVVSLLDSIQQKGDSHVSIASFTSPLANGSQLSEYLKRIGIVELQTLKLS